MEGALENWNLCQAGNYDEANLYADGECFIGDECITGLDNNATYYLQVYDTEGDGIHKFCFATSVNT